MREYAVTTCQNSTTCYEYRWTDFITKYSLCFPICNIIDSAGLSTWRARVVSQEFLVRQITAQPKGAHIGNQDTVAGGRTERCYCKCYCPRVHPYGYDLQLGRVGALWTYSSSTVWKFGKKWQRWLRSLQVRKRDMSQDKWYLSIGGILWICLVTPLCHASSFVKDW